VHTRDVSGDPEHTRIKVPSTRILSMARRRTANGRPSANPAKRVAARKADSAKPVATRKMGTLSGEVALVTGAARRLGKAIALELASAGADVVIHCRESEDEARTLAKDIERMGGGAWVVEADFARSAEGVIAQARKAARQPLSILVNSASSFPQDPLMRMDRRQLDASVTVNAWAPFVLMRGFAAQGQPGCIVNILDSHIIDPERQRASYSIAKGILADMTRMCAMEFAPAIRVNGVAPGPILAPKGLEDVLESLGRRLPLKRHGEPHDIAQAVRYLCEAKFVTGHVLFVDGGRHMQGEDGRR
jgi:pteridine reductase